MRLLLAFVVAVVPFALILLAGIVTIVWLAWSEWGWLGLLGLVGLLLFVAGVAWGMETLWQEAHR